MHATWARIKKTGAWGVRVQDDDPAGLLQFEGKPVPVHRKNGTSSVEVLGKMVRQFEPGVGLFETAAADAAQTNGGPASGIQAAHSATLDALRFMDGRCDGARLRDDVGFNGFDAPFLKQLAQQNGLTLNQERKALEMLRKYKRQLSSGGFDWDKMAREFGAKIRAANTRNGSSQPPAGVQPSRVEWRNNRFVITWPFRGKSDPVLKAMQDMPERKFNGDAKEWYMPRERCLEVDEFAKQFGFKVDADAQAVIEGTRALAQAERERVEALVAASKAADADIETVIKELFPFQRAGVHYALNADCRTFIGDEQGLGKTRQVMEIIEETESYPAVIICPKSALISAWQKEYRELLPHRSVQIVDSGTPLGNGLFSADVYVINYDIISKRVVGFVTLHPKALVLDESQNVKNRKAQRTVAVQALADSMDWDGASTPTVLCTSGTKAINRPAELITQLNIMRRLEDLGGWKRYWHRYCGGSERGAQNLNELNVELRGICMVRRLKKDVMPELPPRLFADVPVPLSNREEYEYAEADFIRWLRETEGDAAAGRAAAAERLVRLGKLRELAAHGKLEATIEWISDFMATDDEQKLVVFAHHRSAQARLLEAVEPWNPVRIASEDSMDERAAAIDRFQTDKTVRVIVCSLRGAGTGITLTAASNVVFLELDWTPAGMLQAVDRCHRIGQHDSVTGWQMVADNTIDEYMAEILAEKRDILEQMLDGRASAEEQSSMVADLCRRYANRSAD